MYFIYHSSTINDVQEYAEKFIQNIKKKMRKSAYHSRRMLICWVSEKINLIYENKKSFFFFFEGVRQKENFE